MGNQEDLMEISLEDYIIDSELKIGTIHAGEIHREGVVILPDTSNNTISYISAFLMGPFVVVKAERVSENSNLEGIVFECSERVDDKSKLNMIEVVNRAQRALEEVPTSSIRREYQNIKHPKVMENNGFVEVSKEDSLRYVLC